MQLVVSKGKYIFISSIGNNHYYYILVKNYSQKIFLKLMALL